MKNKRVVIAAVVVLAFVAGGLWGAGGQVSAASPKKSVDPDADRLLKQMTEYLASLQSFTVRNFAVDEVAMKSGEKIQTTSDSDVAMQRPNHLRSTQRGAGDRLGFWYDGKTMTVACKTNNSFETVAAPPEIDATIDKMRKVFQVDAPGADLLYSKPYDILMEQVVSGRVVGRETVQGVPANHLAYQGENVDWQIWIQEDAQPLPLRFVITTKDVPGHPEFEVQLSNWDTKPKLDDQAFAFKPPAGAKAAKAVVASCGTTR